MLSCAVFLPLAAKGLIIIDIRILFNLYSKRFGSFGRALEGRSQHDVLMHHHFPVVGENELLMAKELRLVSIDSDCLFCLKLNVFVIVNILCITSSQHHALNIISFSCYYYFIFKTDNRAVVQQRLIGLRYTKTKMFAFLKISPIKDIKILSPM